LSDKYGQNRETVTDETVIDSLQFEAEEVTYIEAGTDYRRGTRLYDAGVVGRLHLCLNGRELGYGNKLPATFEMSKTATAMQQMVDTTVTENRVRTTPFYCSCGDSGCTYIQWEIERVDSERLLTMETLDGDPIGDHRYRIRLATLSEAIAALLKTVTAALRASDADETVAGSLRELEHRKDRLLRWSDE